MLLDQGGQGIALMQSRFMIDCEPPEACWQVDLMELRASC